MPTKVDREVVRRMVSEGAQLVEVLPAKQYEAEHIEGALNIPLGTIGSEATRRLNPGRPVIVYCYDSQ